MIDYEILRIIWWVLLGLLLIGFAIFDGFDLGIAMLLPIVAKNDLEKRITINTIGPVWEGNQVWIILGAGAIFAAWPYVYSVAFSGFYFAMLLALMGFILRPVGFKYRSKLQKQSWRNFWDVAIFLGGFIPSFVFGVAIGNVLQGAPFQFDDNLRMFYTGSFWDLLNPFALFCGLVSICMLLMHGSSYLVTKVEDPVRQKAIKTGKISAFLLIVLFAVAGIWIKYGINGFLANVSIADGPSNPLHKQVLLQVGAWTSNYAKYPWMMLAPFVGFLGALYVLLLNHAKHEKLSFLASALSVFGVIATVGVSMFPFILPSSINPNDSLLVWDASSSQLTLFIMLVSTVIFLPIILLYTSWVYHVLRGKVTKNYIEDNEKSVY
ncbi:MAG: cytochrome d ubiquinol oxidase subunit II [Gammaproteobacteria bacterium]